MSDIIEPGLVVLDADLGPEKSGVIRALAARVAESGRATDAEALFADAWKREEQAPTSARRVARARSSSAARRCCISYAVTAPPSPAATPAEVEAAITKGKKFLYSLQRPEGRWEPDPQRKSNNHHDHPKMQGQAWGGFTAIATYGLLAAEAGVHRLLLGGGDQLVRPGQQHRRQFEQASRDLRAYFEARLAALASINTDIAWDGLFAMTPDGLPYVGPHRRYPRHWFALGYGGNGMTFGFLAARLLLERWQGSRSGDHGLFEFGRFS